MASATTQRRLGLTSDKGIKAPVAAATLTNIILSGEQTIDGVAVLATNSAGSPDRVLVKNQTSSIDNGVYDVSTGSWTRSLDSNGSQDLVTGTGYYVVGGSQTGQFWSVSSIGQIIPGTSAITFAQSLNSSLTALAASSGSSLVGFIQKGTGAVSRFVQDKLREAVSVADFSVTGDGTTDDTVNMQKALTNGGRLKITSGMTVKCSSANLTMVANSHLIIEKNATLWLAGTRLSAIGVNNATIGGRGTIKSTSLNTTDPLLTDCAGRGIVEFCGTIATPVKGCGIFDVEVFGDWVGTPGAIVIGANDKRRGVAMQNVQECIAENLNVHGIIAEGIFYNNGIGITTLDYDIVIRNNRIHDCNHDAISPAAFGPQSYITRNNVMWNCLNGIEAHFGDHQGNYAYNMQGSGFGMGGNAIPATMVCIYKNNTGVNNGIATSGICDFNMQSATTPTGTLILENNVSYNAAGTAFAATFVTNLVMHSNRAYGWGRLIAGSAMTSGNVTTADIDNNGAYNEGANSSGGFGFAATTCYLGPNNKAVGVATPWTNTSSTGQGFKAPVIPTVAMVSQQSLTGTVAATPMVTRTVPANYLGLSGGFKIIVQGTSSGAGGTKTINIKFGGTGFGQIIVPSGSQQWRGEFICNNNGTTGNQLYGGITYYGAVVSTGGSGGIAIDTTASKDIVVEGNLASAGDTLTINNCIIEFFNGLLQ